LALSHEISPIAIFQILAVTPSRLLVVCRIYPSFVSGT
jgi:hypothetical protein